MKTKQAEQKGTYLRAFRAAFPYTVPVLTGYLFIGMAFGVMIQEKGYNFLWAMLMSLVIYAGSGQYLAVNFFAPGVSLFNVIFMEFMVNIRHIFYGLSLLERFSEMGKKRLYMIFSLTDETYAVSCTLERLPSEERRETMFYLAVLSHIYWTAASALGGMLGQIIPFDLTGIDFCMTALFVTIFIDQWETAKTHTPALAGLCVAVLALAIFGANGFMLPALLATSGILIFAGRKEVQA